MSRMTALFSSVRATGIRVNIVVGAPPPPATEVPNYSDPEAIQPGFVAGSHTSGSSLVADFGSPLNGASMYHYTWMRNGADLSSGSTGSSATSRTLVSGDIDKLVSLRFYANNSAGDSETIVIPGVLIS